MSEVKTDKVSSITTNGDLTLDPNGTGDTIIASGNVGIGDTTPDDTLTIYGGTQRLRVGNSDSNHVRIGRNSTTGHFEMMRTTTGATDQVFLKAVETNEGSIILQEGGGNVLVGKTNGGAEYTGLTLGATGFITATRDGATAVFVNRETSDGTLIELRKDNSTIGLINVEGGDLALGTGDSGLQFNDAANSVRPFKPSTNAASDNFLDLGQSGDRFDDIYATNGTIQTSDQNEKEQIAILTTAEMTAAKAISKLFKTFKWQDKVAAKGDAARTHTGVIAQEVQTAMTDAGLDAADYAFWCSNTWWEADGETYHTADVAPDGAVERTRLGIRYPELLAFIGAATEQRLADIETRLTALEAE